MAGLLLPRWGERSIILGGFVLTTLGIAGLAVWYQSGMAPQLASLALVGVGLGGVMTAASTAMMLNVHRRRSPAWRPPSKTSPTNWAGYWA